MKTKKRKTVARMIGAIPHAGLNGVLWKVRLSAPYLPFHIDSNMSYVMKADADREVEKWRRRKITIEITR